MSAIQNIYYVSFDWSHFASQTDQFSILRNVLFSGQTLNFLAQQPAGNIQRQVTHPPQFWAHLGAFRRQFQRAVTGVIYTVQRGQQTMTEQFFPGKRTRGYIFEETMPGYVSAETLQRYAATSRYGAWDRALTENRAGRDRGILSEDSGRGRGIPSEDSALRAHAVLSEDSAVRARTILLGDGAGRAC